MDKISLKNLVPEVRIADSKKSNFDINSLLSINNNFEDSIRNFNADYLIKSNKDKREKLLKIYHRYYANCIEKIKLFHNAGKMDLIYEVPEYLSENPDYLSKYCLDFIEIKLKQNYIDTFRIDKKTIFITWKYIESAKK
jgi:hypothetical protein